MNENLKLKFEVTIKDNNFDDELGKELAIFLRESVFNGEDVLEVKYKGYDKK